MNLWCTCAGVPTVMQKVCQQPTTSQTGHAANWSSDSFSIYKGWCHLTGKKQHPAASFRLRMSMEMIPTFAGLFWVFGVFFLMCVFFMHFSAPFSFQMYHVVKISSCPLPRCHGQMFFSTGTMRRKISNMELEQKQKVLCLAITPR